MLGQASSCPAIRFVELNQIAPPIATALVLFARRQGGDVAAPTIDIETISSELLKVQEEAEQEMKAATTLQVNGATDIAGLLLLYCCCMSVTADNEVVAI